MDSNWWNKPLWIGAVQCNLGENSSEIFHKFINKYHFNTEQLNHLFAEGYIAAYDDIKHKDQLDLYLAESRQHGIRQIIYWNVHCVNESKAARNSQWLQRDQNGFPAKIYNSHYMICINSTWFDHFKEELLKICSHDIDGIFLDGPLFSATRCYCEACSNLFQARYMRPLTNGMDAEWNEFCQESLYEFVKKTYAIVKTTRPSILLYMNNASFYDDAAGGHNIRRVEPFLDMLGTEGGFISANQDTSLWKTDTRAKFLEMRANGKPILIFMAGDNKPYSYYMHTAEETKIIFAQTVSNGANIWYGLHAPVSVMNTPGGKAAGEMLSFLNDNIEYYNHTKSVANIALLWSDTGAGIYASLAANKTIDGMDSDTRLLLCEDQYRSFMGFYEMLIRSHLQFDMVSEDQISNDLLMKYETLIIPSCGPMSLSTAENIGEFVSRGGNLICCFHCSLFDEKGIRRSRPLLAEIMGVTEVMDAVNYSIDGTGYLRFGDDYEIVEGLSSKILPSPKYVLRVKPALSAVTIGHYLDPMKGRYEKIPDNMFPGIIYNHYGKGACFYICGAFGEYYLQNTLPDYQKIIKNAVDMMTSPVLWSDAPSSVQLVLRRQDSARRLLLHVINLTGEMARPIERIIPVHNIGIKIYTDQVISQVVNAATGEHIIFRCADNCVSFEISVAGIYDILVLT